MWGYLSEFWDTLSLVTIDAWEYTTEWFQGIGNAVAGAIGGLFDFLLHNFNDLIVFGSWFLMVLSAILKTLLQPIIFLFTFLKEFILKSLSSPTYNTDLQSFSETAKALTSSIPFWSYVSLLIFIALSLGGAFALLKLSKKT